jgi:hypothetical protein
MAEFLQILAEQYDYPHLADEIIRLSLCYSLTNCTGISVARNSTTTIAKGLNPLPHSL